MIYFAHGDAIISSEEIDDDPSLPRRLSEFYSSLAEGEKPAAISFASGELNLTNALTTFDINPPDATPQPISFTKIGPGLPLTIMIREVYSGKFPKGGLFGGGKDMLLTSAVKSIAAFDAKPRAINFLKDKVQPKTRMARPPATKQGTPIVFYSPALLEKSLTMDITMVFDTFPQQVFDQVGDIFGAAAGIPVFQVHSVFLLAAKTLTKLIGQAGEAIFDGKPVFNSSDPINIALPGSPPMPPGFALLSTENIDAIDPQFRQKNHVNELGQVVDQTGAEYKGDVPYVVVSLDGAVQEELSSFAPTAASAAMLSRFFGMKDGQQQPLDVVVDALKLYNDLTFRKQIDQIDKKLEGLPATDPQRAALAEKRKALIANILEEILKPKAA